jgi:hypothetical protein
MASEYSALLLPVSLRRRELELTLTRLSEAGSSPLSSAAPASDVEMADGATNEQQNGSTRKPREATKKRSAVEAGGSDSSDNDDDEATTAISRAKAKAVAASNSSKAGQLYCHQGE